MSDLKESQNNLRMGVVRKGISLACLIEETLAIGVPSKSLKVVATTPKNKSKKKSFGGFG